MRKLLMLVLLVVALVVWQVSAQPNQEGKSAYQLEFNPGKDVSLTAPPPGKEGIYIKVRFSITLDGGAVTTLDDHKIVIEENGQFVREVAVPKPVKTEAITIMLAMDTSGSMKESGRMEQARAASAVFFSKLPKSADCGLILFDHEIRTRLPPTQERAALLKLINTTQARGGTAYLDAAFEGIGVLRSTKLGRDRALVLVTDGIDLNSKKSIQSVIDAAQKEHVRVYTIGIGEPGKLDLVNTVLVLDHSGSMKPPADDIDKTSKIEALHLAGYRFVDSMSTVGRAAIIPFSSSVGRPRPFLDKKQATTLKFMIKNLDPYGETALFDATHAGVCLLEADAARGKRAVIAMTDGFDNSSRRRVEEIIERAKEAKVPLYMLGFGRVSEIDEVTMRHMAKYTGGAYYHAKNKDALLEIFENLSIKLHDDGIDEESLKKISAETGGQYYPAKNAGDLKLIFEQAAQSLQRESHEIVFASLNQRADGAQRIVSLKLVQRRADGTDIDVIPVVTGSYQVRGLVVAEANHLIYLVLLGAIGCLIALPGLLRRTSAA